MNENACIEYTRRPRPFTAIKQLVRNYVKYAAENRTFITVDCILLANRRQFALLKEIMGVRSVGQLAGYNRGRASSFALTNFPVHIQTTHISHLMLRKIKQFQFNYAVIIIIKHSVLLQVQ